MITSNSLRKHYKGNEYKVLTLATHTETGEAMVVYQDISHPEKV